MDSLIKKLETAKQGSSELDLDIAHRIGSCLSDGWVIPFYTTSIDYALSLIPADRFWHERFYWWPDIKRADFELWETDADGNEILKIDGSNSIFAGTARTRALAICVAALKARAAGRA